MNQEYLIPGLNWVVNWVPIEARNKFLDFYGGRDQLLGKVLSDYEESLLDFEKNKKAKHSEIIKRERRQKLPRLERLLLIAPIIGTKSRKAEEIFMRNTLTTYNPEITIEEKDTLVSQALWSKVEGYSIHITDLYIADMKRQNKSNWTMTDCDWGYSYGEAGIRVSLLERKYLSQGFVGIVSRVITDRLFTNGDYRSSLGNPRVRVLDALKNKIILNTEIEDIYYHWGFNSALTSSINGNKLKIRIIEDCSSPNRDGILRVSVRNLRLDPDKRLIEKEDIEVDVYH